MQINDELYGDDEKLIRRLQPKPDHPSKDIDLVAVLADETVSDGHSVLVFCGSRQASLHVCGSIPKCWCVWQI